MYIKVFLEGGTLPPLQEGQMKTSEVGPIRRHLQSPNQLETSAGGCGPWAPVGVGTAQ